MNANLTDRTAQNAARWYARLQADDCTTADREEFERWCGADLANAAAYAEARDLAATITRFAHSDPRLRAMADAALAGTPRSAGRELVHHGFGLAAAALAASIVFAFVAATMLRTPQEPVARLTVARVVAEAAMRVVTLEDGSVVHVDVGSEIEVRFGAKLREVSLQRGRAVFEVAHDEARPFVVAAGGERVTAVGTKFQVTHSPLETVVTLAEGIVTVDGMPSGAERTERLAPGDELRISVSDDAWTFRTVDPRVTTSWSTGRLVFRDTRLLDALREVNRYAATKVRLADASLADLTVSGNFVAGDSRAAVTAFAALLPLRVADAGGELLVYRLN